MMSTGEVRRRRAATDIPRSELPLKPQHQQHINEVTLRQARLALGWVTIYGRQ